MPPQSEFNKGEAHMDMAIRNATTATPSEHPFIFKLAMALLLIGSGLYLFNEINPAKFQGFLNLCLMVVDFCWQMMKDLWVFAKPHLVQFIHAALDTVKELANG